MSNNPSKTTPKVITKSLKYSIITQVVNFNPNKYTPRTIIVDGSLAVRLKGRVFTKI